MFLLKHCTLWVLIFFCASSHAQFLPDNSSLNLQSVQRWMNSNRDLAGVVQALDAMHKTDDDVKKFDALPAVEQDQKIAVFLQENTLQESATAVAARHGWKSVGEYMRFSTRLGNAIAAYFFEQETMNLSDAQRQSIRAKTDPTVLQTPAADIAFVKNHEALLKNYIQAYAAGR